MGVSAARFAHPRDTDRVRTSQPLASLLVALPPLETYAIAVFHDY